MGAKNISNEQASEKPRLLFSWNYFTPAEQLVGEIWGLICPRTLADAALDMNLTTDTLIIEQHALSSEQRTPGNTAVISDRLVNS